jgi:hypothetical protein
MQHAAQHQIPGAAGDCFSFPNNGAMRAALLPKSPRKAL